MIKIDNDCYIEAEQYDYSAWVYRDWINPKTKEVKRSPYRLGFYPSVLSALEAIKNYKVHNCISESVSSLQGALNDIREVLERFTADIKKALEEKNKETDGFRKGIN